MWDSNKGHSLRATLTALIELSGSNLTSDDIICQFCDKTKNKDQKSLLGTLQRISGDYPKAVEHLEEAEQLLQQGEPVKCLLNFAARCSRALKVDMPSSTGTQRKTDMPTSTPFPPKKPFEVPAEAVNEIKERIAQVALDPLKNLTSSCLQGTSTIVSSSKMLTTTHHHHHYHDTISNNNISHDLFPKTIHNSFEMKPWNSNSIDSIQLPLRTLSGINVVSQENILLYDLIYVLTGLRSSFIYPEKREESPEQVSVKGSRYIISDQVHKSLKDIIEEILPLATYYDCIKRFIDYASFSDCGQVLQAFTNSLVFLLQDYKLLLTQLETEYLAGHLTLQKLHFYVHPTLNTMEVLADLVLEIVNNGHRGGQALTLLFSKINSLTGDEESQKFVIKLTQDAAVPYMGILLLWIEKGVISDPQHEFLVEDNEIIRREELPEHYSADYWEKRYTIRRERIPCFLDKLSDLILRTGKYLNVIRQCGKTISHTQNIELNFSVTNTNYISAIENAYSFAAKNLLEVLLKENDLMGHLYSVKRYLLLQQGDFISQFMDTCETELNKNIDQVLPMTLENLLGLTLRISAANNDPYKDEVHCELLTYDLVTQMTKIINNEEEFWETYGGLDLTGVECFAFRYDAKWPISLVLNHIAMSKYQMLFRQLFYLKHVERQVCMIWSESSVAKKFSAPAAALYRTAFTLSTRILNAVQNLEYYMMIEVIEPNWHIFLQNMSKVENVDQVLAFHQDFLDSCLRNCLLRDTLHLNRSIFKMCKISLNFCDFMFKCQKHYFQAVDDENFEDISCSMEEEEPTPKTESSIAPSETFGERVKKFTLEFTGALVTFLNQINELAAEHPSDRFINLVHRINFNLFYNEQAENLCATKAMAKTNGNVETVR